MKFKRTLLSSVVVAISASPAALLAAEQHGAEGSDRTQATSSAQSTASGEQSTPDSSISDAEEHDVYLAEMKREVSTWDDKVSELGNEAGEKGRELSADAREAVTKSWSGVKSAWYTLQGSSGELWRDTQATFEEAWQEFQQTWNENVEKNSGQAG